MKINAVNVLVSFMIACLLQGCVESNLKPKNLTGQPELNVEELKRLVLLNRDFVYPEDQARMNVMALAAKFLEGNDGLKRTIDTVITVPSLYTVNKTTSIKTDFNISKPWTPSMYIYNFKEKLGFIIVSADKRATETIAIVANGAIEESSHLGYQVFLSNTVSYIDKRVSEMESLRNDRSFQTLVEKFKISAASDISKKSGSGRIESEPCTNCGDCSLIVTTTPIQSITSTYYIAQPLLNTLWSQEPPYNNSQTSAGCNTSSFCGQNDKYLAGCVPVAEGQVVAYFKAQTIPAWQALTSKSCETYTTDEANMAANLLKSIYTGYDIQNPIVSITCNATGAGANFGDIHLIAPVGISPIFGLVQGEWRPWNTTDLRSSLYLGKPVVIMGTPNLCCLIWCWGCGIGHEWVVDGMRDLNVETTYQSASYYDGPECNSYQQNYFQTYTYTTTTTTTQIHQNWGWGAGRGSGPNDWYAQNVFETNYPHIGDYNFNHANYIIAYITPL